MTKAIKRVKGNDGNTVGTRHNNPMLDTSEYTIEMPNGSSQELTDNINLCEHRLSDDISGQFL